jgi:hypothetical protein
MNAETVRKKAAAFHMMANLTAMTFAFFTVGVLGFQLYGWLKTDAWPAYPLSRVLYELQIDTPPVGTTQVRDFYGFLIQLPVAFWLIAVGLMVSVILNAIATELPKLAKKKDGED